MPTQGLGDPSELGRVGGSDGGQRPATTTVPANHSWLQGATSSINGIEMNDDRKSISKERSLRERASPSRHWSTISVGRRCIIKVRGWFTVSWPYSLFFEPAIGVKDDPRFTDPQYTLDGGGQD